MAAELFCPICGNELDINGSMAKCPVCGYSSSVKAVTERSTHKKNAGDEIELYRLLSSADTFFARKSYAEAYTGYCSALDADRGCLKARFRRELTSQYLMMETSSVYLNCESFFAVIKDVKARLLEEKDEKLSLTVCRDMLDFMSARADYEKKYASLHKNERAAAAYMSDTLLLYEYTSETVKEISEKPGVRNEKERAYLVVDGCALGMKLRAMLLSGGEYVEASEITGVSGGEQAVKNVGRIKRLRLSQEEELQVEVLAGGMRRAKSELMESVPQELYNELKDAGEKSEKEAVQPLEDEEKKREEYEEWRSRNEKEYLAADKKILIFGIAGKAALVMTAIMVVTFFAELIIRDVFMEQLIVIGVLFAAAYIALGFLRKDAEKKKGFYSKVIDGDSANIRRDGDFIE